MSESCAADAADAAAPRYLLVAPCEPGECHIYYSQQRKTLPHALALAAYTGRTLVRRCNNVPDARWVRVQLPGKSRILRLLEVEVYRATNASPPAMAASHVPPIPPFPMSPPAIPKGNPKAPPPPPSAWT